MKRYNISDEAVLDLHPSQQLLVEDSKGEYVKRKDVIRLLEQIASHSDIPPKAAVIKHINEVM